MAQIELRSLLSADPQELAEILNDPRVRLHMPLADQIVDAAWVQSWQKSKVAQWPLESDLGPWAVYVDGQLAGWGGLQPEQKSTEVGLAMVLSPSYWGLGVETTGLALDLFRRRAVIAGLRIERALIEFPESRNASRLLNRLGFSEIEACDISGIKFNRYAMTLID